MSSFMPMVKEKDPTQVEVSIFIKYTKRLAISRIIFNYDDKAMLAQVFAKVKKYNKVLY